ncbi:hypothetical protein IMZ29_04180 [Achromobacter sp. GG226]|uniref:hypothetical protein n=1 Tax=Verticiella alkaliphila TaxID=2779529 RepID=UPI001C0ABE50|nr:hypothetical protein [Verticiella sp. GG226]MBU4609772.1 hypothetical protein [Verticiella sp. GG226]
MNNPQTPTVESLDTLDDEQLDAVAGGSCLDDFLDKLLHPTRGIPHETHTQ